MEPATLKTSDEKALETWLCNQSADTLADDGFTHRVMAALPERRASRWWENRERLTLLAGATVLGYWIATRGPAGSPAHDEILIPAASLLSQFAQSLADPAVLPIVVLALGSLLLTTSTKLFGIDPD